eukprot:TRINITY_DN9229_c2_g1_i2.p1 TRINITY_DN9229_c2_g1~~TRINITY_DN9229_c2_g1_i2.p1  ORF type:complete len:249 (-),score=55.74 TRINITY_DN9229_c2_g1_i2:76-822(-)
MKAMSPVRQVTRALRVVVDGSGVDPGGPGPLAGSVRTPVNAPSNLSLTSPIPPHQTTSLELIPLVKNSTEWVTVEKRFNETMAGKGRITSVVKIANKRLWQKFTLECEQVMEKNGNDPLLTYTRLLFHGTRATPPEVIYNSESGFMMQFSSKGMWGIGTYFAEKAVYSNDYCHTLGSSKQMFLAIVLTGDSYDCKPDGSLKVPPERKKKNTNMAVERYDSVTGITNGSRVYIVYENNKAYPLYLITYM